MDNIFHADLDTIRRQARLHLEDGAVTQGYGLEREKVLSVLNDLLATEIVCTLRYRNNAYVAQGIHSEVVAKEFLEHAQEEQMHADKLAVRITQLGGRPNMDPAVISKRSHAEYTTSDNLAQLLEENLVAERVAISTYTDVIRWLGDKDPTTRRMLESILEQEEEHAEDLSTLLKGKTPVL